MSNQPERCLSNLAIEKALAADGWQQPISDTDQRHIADCAKCRTRLEEARELESHFVGSIVPRTLPSLQSRASSSQPTPFFSLSLVLAGAAMACGLVVVTVSLMDKESSSSEGTSVVAPGGHGGTGPEAYIGIKGGARLQLHVKRGDRRFVHIGDAALHPADEIRFQVQGGGWPFLMVIYEDPQGGREVVSPWQGERSLKLDSPEFYPDDALKLDGGLGEERIVAVFSDHSLSSVQVLEWLAQGGSGPGLHEIGGGRIEAVVTTYFKEAPQ